jgi:hypothetical protein
MPVMGCHGVSLREGNRHYYKSVLFLDIAIVEQAVVVDACRIPTVKL